MNILLAFVIFTGIALLATRSPCASARSSPTHRPQTAGLQGGQSRPARTPNGHARLRRHRRPDRRHRWPTFPRSSTLGRRRHAPRDLPACARRPGGRRSPSGSNDGTSADVAVTLRHPTADQGALGVTFAASDQETQRHGPVTPMRPAFARTVDASTLILRGLGDSSPTSATRRYRAGGHRQRHRNGAADQLPPVFLIWFIGLLSANLAVVNALPFPPLDGGRVAVAIDPGSHRQPHRRRG